MSLLSTFSTNSINILAGINGSEVSQALIIALSVVLNDLLYLPWPMDFRIPLHLLGNKAEVGIGGVWSAGMAYGSRELVERHLFSLYFMLPLVAVCIGFLYHNWYVGIGLSSSRIHRRQVSCACVPGRYTLLPHRNGIRGRWNPSPFFEDSIIILHPANFQLFVVVPTVVWPCSLPST